MLDHTDFHIRKVPGTHVVRAGGAVIGESREALEVTAGELPPVIYFPKADLAMAFLEPSERREERKAVGVISWYGIATKSGIMTDAAWVHPEAEGDTARLAGHIAFDTSRVTVERV